MSVLRAEAVWNGRQDQTARHRQGTNRLIFIRGTPATSTTPLEHPSLTFILRPSWRGTLVVREQQGGPPVTGRTLPPLLRSGGVEPEEYQECMRLLQLRLRAWKGRRIYATALAWFIGGEASFWFFYQESLYYSLLLVFGLLSSMYVADFWLKAEHFNLRMDIESLLFSQWMPFIETHLSWSSWGALVPIYKLTFYRRIPLLPEP